MNQLLNRILLSSIFLLGSALTAKAVCPTPGATVIEVCNDASQNATMRAYFFDGDPGVSYFLFSITQGTYISDPLGPVTVDPSIPLPPGAVAGVEFAGIPDGDYIIRVNCQGGGFVNIGGLGINVSSLNALNAGITVDPDCNPGTGGANADGSITINISGGTGPFDIAWPVAVTPIPPSNNVPAGNHVFANLDGGAYTATITDANGCEFTSVINVPLSTLPLAGPDQTVCGTTANLAANAPGIDETGTWSGPAGVIFFPNASAPNAIVSNLAVGVNILTWTITDTNGICGGISDQVQITSEAPATVDAGLPQAICAGSTVSLAATMGGSAGSVTWTTSGDGSFDDATLLNAVYAPGPNDESSGTVTLTITTNDPAGPCVAVNDNVVITINAAVDVDAGAPQTICSDGSATLAATAGAGASWSTSGDGSFDDASSPTAVYTPGPNDITNGDVTLTFTTIDPPGPCLPASDDVIITIDPAVEVDAGAPQSICSGSTVSLSGTMANAPDVSWSTSGDGTFDNASILNPVYTPGPNDVSGGSVTLTITTGDPAGPCAPKIDNVLITIDPDVTVDAGAPQTICSGSTATVTATLGGAVSTGSWSSPGDGSFNDNTLLTAIYTPGPTDIANGSVTLTFTTDDPAGACLPATDDVVLTIDAAPTVDAGGAQMICAGSAVTLAGTIGGAASSATWTTGGDGTFDDATALGAVYTPGPADIAAGIVTLTLTTNDPAGPCTAVSDAVNIGIAPAPTVDAGPAQTVCANGTVSLSGSFGGSATSASWSTSGDGSFDDATSTTAIYTPGPNDLANGTVTLTFSTNDPAGPCEAVTDDVVITIDEEPTADAGIAQTICAGSTVSLAGTIGGSASATTWTTAGDGTFDDANSLTAVYTPGANDLITGLVTLTLSTDDPSGPCIAATDNVVITIDDAPTVDAGADQTICVGGTAVLSATVGGTASSGTWTTSGDGTFDDASSLTAVYTPGANDITNGTVTLTLTSDDPAGPCTPASNDVIITIEAEPSVDAGPAQTVCEGNTVSLAGSIGGSASSASWSTSGDGSFDDATSLTAIYTPGTADISAGTVTLTLTTNDPSGPCGAASDPVVITIDPQPVSEAGSPQTICAAVATPLAGSSVSGTATTGAWSIVLQPAGGDGLLSSTAMTANPSSVTFSATIAGAYTLRLTTDDPAGVCTPDTDDVIITVTAGATVDAGLPQTICESGSATLGATFTGTTGITWSTAGDGTFNDASLANAIYTPGANDIVNGAVTLTATTAGPCPSVNDNVVLTIAPDPTVDAGAPVTICSTGSVVLNAIFGGSATGILWSTSGDGSFDDTTDPNATYTPGSNDSANGSVVLTATATGSCPGTNDAVTITLNPAATIDAGAPQSVCVGNAVQLAASIGGAATGVTWTTSGDGTFDDNTDVNAVYTPGANDIINGSVTLTATTNNPAGPCPASSDGVVITFTNIAGDQTTAGNETWIGYVYDDSGDATPYPSRVDFNTTKYRGYIEATDIDNMTGASSYDTPADVFDLNLAIADPLQGPNVCGNYLNNFSVRYKMSKTFAAGVYRLTVGGDDGVMLLVDGVSVIPAAAFNIQGYTTYTTQPLCLGGLHEIEIHYFDNTAQSRLTFDYEEVPPLTTNHPVQVCVNSPAPTLSVSSPDTDVVTFNWYKNGVLVFSGDNYVPGAAELDMATAATTSFTVTAVYACGETPAETVDVEVLNGATVTINPQTICESAGAVDLRAFVSAIPSGGSFVFTGTNVSGNMFDPSGLAGSTVSIAVDYTAGSCTSPQGTLDITVTSAASVTVPSSAVAVCEASPVLDLRTLVSSVPPGGTFVFAGPQVTGNDFDPSGLSGVQTITVDYSIGGCIAPQVSFDIDVAPAASVTATNTAVCENGSAINLLTLVNATPGGGAFTFTGAGVTGNVFNPSGQSGVVSITVDYDFNGCTDSDVIQVTVRAPGDPLCLGGNCATVVIVPKVEPATCTNSDGRMVMSIKPFTPAINNTGVTITIDGISSTGLNITRTIINDSIFNALPVGNYDYTIEYGDPSCVKTGIFSIDQSGTVGTPVVSNIVSPSCFGTATGAVILDVPGETGNVLEWSLDGGLTDPFKPFTAGALVTGIPAGPSPSFQQVISVRRNIADVCYASVTFTMMEAVTAISATFDVTPATCNGNDGAIANIVASGGAGGPYTFSIDGGQTFQAGNAFNGLAGGNYTVRVRDAGGCESDFAATVTFPGFINSTITKTNANCANGGQSGAIAVTVTDLGSFQVALSTDQFNPPPDAQYVPYIGPAVNFSQLSKGQYYVYIKSGSGVCPTRSAPINILGIYDITFDLHPVCENNELSLVLENVTGETGGAPLEIQVTKKLSSAPPEIIYQQFPADGEIYLSHDDYVFLQTPGEYSIRIIQFQFEAVCNLSSESVDYTVSSPLSAQIGAVAESYPDVPSGQMLVTTFTGGSYPYEVRIELDSAASFSLPFHSTEFEEAGVSGNQQVEMSYTEIPAGRYLVEVRDSVGCVIELVARVPLDRDLYVPNVFTPNGDGANDVFFIRNLPQEAGENQLVITNRWGKKVFVSENYQNNWDASDTVDGIYFYSLRLGNADQPVTGWIEIIRGPKP